MRPLYRSLHRSLQLCPLTLILCLLPFITAAQTRLTTLDEELEKTSFPTLSKEEQAKVVAARKSNIVEAEETYDKLIAPIQKSLELNTRLYQQNAALKKEADAAVAKDKKEKNAVTRYFNDESMRLDAEQGAAAMAMRNYAKKVRSLKAQIQRLENQKKSYIDNENLQITLADEKARNDEIARRYVEEETLNEEFYTAKAKRVATERVFNEKIAVMDKLIEATKKDGLDEGVEALTKDRETLVKVKDQYLTGVDTEISSASRSLNAAYRKNAQDKIGPTVSSNETKDDDAAFVDQTRVANSVERSRTVAGNATANTRHEISLATFAEDYGKTAVRNEKTGELEIFKSPIKSVDWEKGEVEWTDMASRYGHYWKGAGTGTKNIVVDLLTLLAVGTETVAQSVEVATNSVRDKENQTNYTGTDKIDKVYTGANFLAEAAAGDPKIKKLRRDQMATAVERGASMLERKVETTAGSGKKGINQGMNFAGQVAAEFMFDMWSPLGKADDVGKLSKAQSNDILKRLDADEFNSRPKFVDQDAKGFVKDLKKNGLEPKQTLETRGKKFHVSEPFESNGRKMVIAFEEAADGSMKQRMFYLSGEHGVWRAAPETGIFDGNPVLSKGAKDDLGTFVNEGAVDLDVGLQLQLDALAASSKPKKLKDEVGARLVTGALQIAEPRAGVVPKTMGGEAADFSKALPGEPKLDPTGLAGRKPTGTSKDLLPDALPEAMRPDWANGLVGKSTVENHPLYGKIERFVYKSQDGKTDWIINRAENGDVWIGSMQDATAGVSGLGTRTKAWQASGLTAQPFTKGDGGYVPADNWKNPFNDYMAQHLPDAPNGPPTASRAPGPQQLEANVSPRAETGSDAARRGSNAAKARERTGVDADDAWYDRVTNREYAIRMSGIVPEHAEAISGVAVKRDEIVIIRPVNPDSTAKIAAGASTKPMNIKGKSTGWGPKEVRGLIPFDTHFSKMGDPDSPIKYTEFDFRKYQELNNKAVGEAWHEFVEGKWVKRDAVEPIAARKKLYDKDGKPVLAEDGTHLEVLAELRPKTGPDGKPMIGPDGKPVMEAGNPIAADYDMMAHGVKGKDHGEDIVGHPELGTTNTREVGALEAVNEAVDGTGHTGGKVMHHGGANQFAKEFEKGDFQLFVATPDGRIATLVSPREFQQFVEYWARRGYSIKVHPDWGMGITDPAERLAAARAGDAKRAATQSGEAADKAPTDLRTVPRRTATARGGARAGNEAADAKKEQEEKDREEFLIAMGGAPGGVVVDPISFEFWRTTYPIKDDWVEPAEEPLVSVGGGWTFELESAISLAGEGVHSATDLGGTKTTTERAPPPPPPQKKDPPPPPPPAEKPPEIVIGQPPLKEEPKDPPKEEPKEPPKKQEKKPPPPPPPVEKDKEIRIGRGASGTIHFDGFSVACSVFFVDDGDTDDVSGATVRASGPGGSADYDVSLYGGYEFRVEHKIYSYGDYDFELREVRDKNGEPMTIMGNRFNNYKVGAEAKPCW